MRIHELINECDDVMPDVKTYSAEELAAKHNVPLEQINSQLAMGIDVEMEHTTDPKLAKEIALDHILELPDYYTKLAKVEK